jgi:transcriptional regulator with XRE-family HTH domain
MSRITQLRNERGLSVEAFAKAIGLSKSQISRIENGIHLPRPRVAQAIETFFGVDTITRDQILFPDETKSPRKPVRSVTVRRKPIRSTRATLTGASR